MAQTKYLKWVDFGIKGTQNDDGSFSLVVQPHREQLMTQYRCEIPVVEGAEATMTKLALDSDLAREVIPAMATGNAVPVDFAAQVDAEIIRIRKRDLRAQQAVLQAEIDTLNARLTLLDAGTVA
jgi:hypothetical protein